MAGSGERLLRMKHRGYRPFGVARCRYPRSRMNIVVLVKSIPDPNGDAELGDDFLVERDGEGTLDPGDEYAVEAALQLAEATTGEVTVLSMGPAGAVSAIRRALSMGAHRAVLVSDDALRGADVLATARVLGAAIGRAPFDLVLTGVESTDGYTGTLPMTVAELLGLPAATFARKLDVVGDVKGSERQITFARQPDRCPWRPTAPLRGSGRSTPPRTSASRRRRPGSRGSAPVGEQGHQR